MSLPTHHFDSISTWQLLIFTIIQREDNLMMAHGCSDAIRIFIRIRRAGHAPEMLFLKYKTNKYKTTTLAQSFPVQNCDCCP